MKEIYNLNLSENTLKCMIELNPNLLNMSDVEIKEKKLILEKVNCKQNEIRNIISSNSLFLNKTTEELVNLINKLYEYHFKNLNILFDSNPYILNLEPFEIEDYISDKIKEGKTTEDIVDELSSDPFLFNEI